MQIRKQIQIRYDQVIIGANLDEGLLDTVNLLLNPALYDQLRRGWAVAGPVMLFGKRWILI